MNCRFRETDDGRLKCVACGRLIRKPPGGQQPRAACRSAPREPQHWLTCPHRGPVLATVNARAAGCGCGSSEVELYECRRFNEPVLKIAANRCGDKIRESAPGYAGRTCRECRTHEECDILHITPRPDWQHVTTRGRFALAGLGLTVSEESTPTPQRFAERVERSKPQAVFVHAFCVQASHVIQAARRWPAVWFVVVSHSQENHVMQWPQFFAEIRDTLTAAATLPNLYYAGSDEAQHWQALGHANVIRWHWPCVLTEWREPPVVEPETVLISSRADLVKALPSQVIAAGLLQRSRGCRVAMSLNHESAQRRDGIAALAQAAGVQIDRWPWLTHEAFIERLRSDVSIVLQPSLSETFNYVSWEAGSVGRPWVGSDAIKHTPTGWRADPNSPADIARVAGEILDDYEAASRRAWEIADAVGRRNNEAYRAGIEQLL